MAEKRETDREPKRINVRFGPDGTSLMGFTKNISPTGVRIECRKAYPAGTVLQLTLGDDETVRVGKVMWTRNLAAMSSPMNRMFAMGIAFEDPA